jgi:hypothetical protein
MIDRSIGLAAHMERLVEAAPDLAPAAPLSWSGAGRTRIAEPLR